MTRTRWILVLTAAALLAVGLLVVLPAVQRYVRRSMTSQATMTVRQMFDGSVSYFTTDHGPGMKRRFPRTVGLTPDAPFCRDGEPLAVAVGPETFADPTWQALGIHPEGPLYFRFAYISEGLGMSEARFTARAVGDLDCDGVPTTYERVAGPEDHEDCALDGGRGLVVTGGPQD